MIRRMAITANDVQGMVSHWLGCRPNGYLGSGYGSGVRDILQTPLASGAADRLLAKLREDVPIIGQMPPALVNVAAAPAAGTPDRLDLFVEVAGSYVQIED